MTLDQKRLKYLTDKFGVEGLSLEPEDSRDGRNIQRQKYIDEQFERNDRDMLNKANQIRRRNIFNYVDTASMRGHEIAMFIEVTLHRGR